MGSELITSEHLSRRAVVYVRQSTPHQVVNNQESLRLQYALRQRAHELGWHDGAIDVIDVDLGLSGAGATYREGFKELVARVTFGEIGLILSTDVTRLTRNCTDWYPLLDVCGYRHCLIGDRDGIYDPGTTDGRLLLGLKGTISEVELHTIRARLGAGLLLKAKRGELVQQLPAGLTRDATGIVTKDPSREVQERIALVFASFLERRTAAKVVRWLVAHDLMLPRRDRFGELCWKRASLPSVLAILKNPAYAGAFVYGRYGYGSATRTQERPLRVTRPMADWRVVVKDKYPAYISWPVYEKIQAMLRDNRAEYQRVRSRGIARNGATLLHGIVWCGECGHKMVVRYNDGGYYVCEYLHRRHETGVCQHLQAAPIDAAVAAAFLTAVAPAEIEAWSRARKAQCQADEALRRAEEQQVERLRYQATLAQRQFDQVDPDNRLVAAELERRWEAALVALRRAEQALARSRSEASPPDGDRIDPDLRGKIVRLGHRLPDIWADPATRQEHRKALLRCLIDKVVTHRTARDQAQVRIIWRGGATTELSVMLPVNALRALSRHAEMQARVLELARAGLRDHEIARTLTTEGYRSPRRSAGVLPHTVQNIRLRNGLKVIPGHPRWPRAPGQLTLTDIAARLQVSIHWLRAKLRRGAITTIQEPSGRYLFHDNEATLHALRRLRDGLVNHVDLTQSS